jgi:hypothetical protein
MNLEVLFSWLILVIGLLTVLCIGAAIGDWLDRRTPR